MSDIPPPYPVDPSLPELSQPPIFTAQQVDAILELVTPLMMTAVGMAVEEARASTPVPVLRPGACRSVDVLSRTCQVLLDTDDETQPNVEPVNAIVVGQHPFVGGRVMVLFAPPSSVYVLAAESALPPGIVVGYAGIVTTDTIGDPSTLVPPPPGWVRPYGQLVNIASYAALYDAIGTTFNTGGETAGLTFRLPDMRGRTIFGLDSMGGSDAARLSTANTLGTTLGTETHTIASGNLPTHTHDMGNHTHGVGSFAGAAHTHSFSATTDNPGDHSHTQPNSSDITGIGAFSAGANVAANAFTSSPNTGNAGGHTHSVSGTTGGASATSITGTSAGPSTNTTGNGGFANSAVNHMNPGITLHWLIKY